MSLETVVLKFSGRWMRGTGVGGLLFSSVLLAGLLSFEDGVLALDLSPAHAAVGQVPDYAWQLSDLGVEENKVVRETSHDNGKYIIDPPLPSLLLATANTLSRTVIAIASSDLSPQRNLLVWILFINGVESNVVQV